MNCFYCYISLCRSAEASACCILSHEDIIYDAYMQEFNAVMLYVVIFVLSQCARAQNAYKLLSDEQTFSSSLCSLSL